MGVCRHVRIAALQLARPAAVSFGAEDVGPDEPIFHQICPIG
jgi:hypothetical protein